MNAANIPDDMRKYVSKECIKCVTHVDGLVVRTINKKNTTQDKRDINRQK